MPAYLSELFSTSSKDNSVISLLCQTPYTSNWDLKRKDLRQTWKHMTFVLISSGMGSTEGKTCFSGVAATQAGFMFLQTKERRRHFWKDSNIPKDFIGFPGGSDGKESACKAGIPALIPGLGRSPGEGKGYLLQYPCLENSMNRGAWRATVHGVTKSQTWLGDCHVYFHWLQRNEVSQWCQETEHGQVRLLWDLRVILP